jgi:hypothetical protein
MAAANWQIHYAVRKHLADGGFNLATDTLMISLFASDSNAISRSPPSAASCTKSKAAATRRSQ